MSKKIFIIFVIIGIALACFDTYILPIYVIVVPIQYYFFYSSLKCRNLPFLIIELIWFIALGLGSVTFYLGRENAQSIGFRAIGDFDFSYGYFFTVYAYLFLLQCVLLFVVKKHTHRNYKYHIIEFLEGEVSAFQKKSSLSLMPIAICTLIFSAISAWMYFSHIGMVGLQQTRLPYHLTGVLFYSRRFLFTAILLLLYLKTTNKGIAAIFLIGYAFFVSITGTSKSLGLMLLVPTAFICYVSNYKKTCWATAISIAIIYNVVSVLRVFIYEEDADMNLTSLFIEGMPIFLEGFSIGDFIVDFIGSFCERLFNYQAAVLTYQYKGITLTDFFDFYLSGGVATKLVPDYAQTLFGIVLPEDKAFGLGWGYVGTYILLSNHNFFLAIIQSIIVALNFVLQNMYYQNIMMSKRRMIQYLAIGFLVIGMMGFNDGNQIFYLYAPTLVLYVINRFYL